MKALPQVQKDVLKTLAYYHALSKVSLTALEVQKYLYREKGVNRNYSLFSIHKALDTLLEKNLAIENNGFWALSATEESPSKIFENRIINSKHSALKWKKFVKTGRFLPYLPFISSIAITGSTALNNAKGESDIDILITSKKGTIWSARFLVTIASFLLKRRRYGGKIENRLCFNQYVSQNTSNLGPPEINNIVNSIKISVWDSENTTTNEALYSLKPSGYLLWIKHTTESILNISYLDRLLEAITAKMQIAKIQKNPTDYPKELEQPSVNSTNLIFYYPRVKATQQKYKETMQSLGYNPDTIRTRGV